MLTPYNWLMDFRVSPRAYRVLISSSRSRIASRSASERAGRKRGVKPLLRSRATVSAKSSRGTPARAATSAVVRVPSDKDRINANLSSCLAELFHRIGISDFTTLESDVQRHVARHRHRELHPVNRNLQHTVPRCPVRHQDCVNHSSHKADPARLLHMRR